MAAFYIEALRLIQPEGPYLLGGWSMGAIVAFEMAQQLEALGQNVSLLALIDSKAPLGDNESSLLDQETIHGSFALDLALSWENPHFSWEQFWQLRANDKLAFVLEQAKEAHLVSASFELSNVQRLLNVFGANVRAMASYKPQNYPGRVKLFTAGEPSNEERSDPTKGWSLLAAEVETQVIPGNHYTMLREPNVKVLASQLSASMDQANDGVRNRSLRGTKVLEIARLHSDDITENSLRNMACQPDFVS
jgi:thioesterase domain-containing protein